MGQELFSFPPSFSPSLPPFSFFGLGEMRGEEEVEEGEREEREEEVEWLGEREEEEKAGEGEEEREGEEVWEEEVMERLERLV